MSHFTPIASGIGGILIGISASILLAVHGKVAGISGLYGGLF
ncbi:MAG: YeeE/YedE family protein, partial [Myxococcales bacterium]|nr:YeeE/YedE family protein [Myxococcales bacterium]